jgi:cytochrome c1
MMNLQRRRLTAIPLAAPIETGLACVVLLGACARQPPRTDIDGADPARGKAQIVAYGCGSCHLIPGVSGARGLVGPPLTHFAQRAFIAGQVPNNSEFLVRWISVPQAIEPGTAMPNLGVSEHEARDIAAYLYTLR